MCFSKTGKIFNERVLVTMEIDIICAIDPGVSAGGIVVYKPGNDLVTIPMPRTAKGIFNVFQKVKRSGSPAIFIERLSVRGGDSGGGKEFRIATMLENYNYLVCCALVLDIPLFLCAPISWQSGLNLREKGEKEEKKDRKEKYLNYAIKQFPLANVKLWNSDAICILRFAQMKMICDVDWFSSNMQNENSTEIAFSPPLLDDSIKFVEIYGFKRKRSKKRSN